MFMNVLRPLQCPQSNCRKYVSISDLIAHFQHEHINIPIMKTALDERNAFTFSPKNVQTGSQKCIALLRIVTQKLEADNTNQR